MQNGAGGYGATGGGSKKLQQTHAQVNEVVGIMRENVEKVIDRDIKLSELDDRADALQQGASQFETQAAKLKRKYWWKNMKMWLIMIAIGVIVLVIIIMSQTKAGPGANSIPSTNQENQGNPAVVAPPSPTENSAKSDGPTGEGG